MSTEALPQEWRDKLVEWARQHNRIDWIFLFGSRARSEHRPDGDLDLAVLLTEPTQSDPETIDAHWIFEVEQWRTELKPMFPVSVHLELARPRSDNRVWPGVLQDGRPIYCRQQYASD
jgi:uncharacterized protein